MNPLKQLVKHSMGLLLPPHRYLHQGPRTTRDIALTFDDGPHPELTDRLLDQLKALEIRATFFVLGQQASESPWLIERIVSSGHTLGHHSWSHSEPDATSAQQLVDEIGQTHRLLEQIVGLTPSLFRPPKGKLTWAKFQALWKLGQTIILWNVDPRDYSLEPGETLDIWCRNYCPTAGDILLFHDIHPYCLNAVEQLAARKEFKRDWRFQTLDDWLKPRPFVPRTEVAFPCR